MLGHGLITMKRIFNWIPSFEEASKLEIPAVCVNEVLGPPQAQPQNKRGEDDQGRKRSTLTSSDNIDC